MFFRLFSALTTIICTLILSGCGALNPALSNIQNEKVDLDNSVRGLYKGIVQHEGSKFFQYADVTLRTTNPSGQLKIAANVKLYFGDRNSPEFFTYEFPDCAYNLLTGEISILNDQNDISIVGKLQNNVLEGEWFSQINGKIGKVLATKPEETKPAEDQILVKPLSGHYRGKVENKNPQTRVPEKISTTFVSTQENVNGVLQIKISGSARFYIGEFESNEYFETPFTDIQFNFNTRYLTAKTRDYGMTYKGTISQDGIFTGVLFSDGFGEIGPASFTLVQK